MDNVNINGQNIIIGLEDEVTNFHTSIYPNTTKGMFSIRTDVADLKVEIYTALGILVIKESVTGGLQQIDLSQQPKGIYFVKLMHDGKTEQRKLILQ